MKKIFLLPVLFLVVALGWTAYAQQIMMAQYVPVFQTMDLGGKPIPGFIQDIPVGFSDIVQLHDKGAIPKPAAIKPLLDATEKELSITPENDDLYFKKGILLFENGDLDQAEKVLERVIDRSSKPEIKQDAFFYMGLISAKRAAYKESAYYFQRCIDINNKRINAYINLGIAFFYLGDYEKSTDMFETALILRPEDPIVYFYRGLISFKKGDMEKAATGFRWAKHFRMDDPTYNNWTSHVMQQDKRIGQFNESIAGNPTNPYNYAELGWIYINYGEVQKAGANFTKAVELDGKSWRALEGMSEYYLYKGDFKLAEDYMLKAVAAAPENGSILYGAIGRIRYHAGNYAGTEESLNKAISVSAPGQDYYARALLGQLYVRQGNVIKAKEQLAICDKIGVNHPEVEELRMKIARFERLNK